MKAAFHKGRQLETAKQATNKREAQMRKVLSIGLYNDIDNIGLFILFHRADGLFVGAGTDRDHQ